MCRPTISHEDGELPSSPTIRLPFLNFISTVRGDSHICPELSWLVRCLGLDRQCSLDVHGYCTHTALSLETSRLDLVPLPALLVAGLALGVAAATPVAAAGRLRRGEPLSRVAISSGLMTFVALQLAAGLLLLDATWPLTGYPMYAPHIPGGADVEVLLLEGTTIEGQQLAIPAESLFADPLDLQARVLPLLRDPDAQAVVAKHLLQSLNRERQATAVPLVALRGSVERRSLTAGGEVVRAVEPVFVYPTEHR